MPLAGELFSDGEWDVGHLAELGVRLWCLVSNWFFNEVECVGSEFVAEGCCFSDGVAVVDVDADYWLRSEDFAGCVEGGGGRCEGYSWLE